MWYGRMAFLLKGSENWGPAGEALISVHDARVQTMQAVLLARAIENVQVGHRSGREVWDRIYAITAFYVGLADDLTPYEYVEAVEKVFESSFEPSDLENEDKFLALKTELALLPSPEIFGGTGNAMVIPPVTAETLNELLDKTKGMRFMGQRFIPDSYMFQHLVFPEVLDYTGNSDPKPFTYGSTGVRGARCYPRGLDVMAVLGSDRAKAILIEEGDTDYVDYELRFNELRAEFDALSLADWNRNLYWGWLYSLQALLGEFPEGYPNFMRTQTWEKKELNAALASWTELRHDTILYAKQSYTPIETGLPPAVKGYVEPVPEFYGRLLALTRMTKEGLMDFGALSTQGEERLVNLENMLSQLIEIANKELTNEMLMEGDYEYIRNFGSILERAVLGVDEEGVSTTLVADVHTHTAEGKVLEEGVGYVELIVAACPLANGGAFLAAGPVLSYYEFKHPMNDRLTDEAWRELLKSPERPERPTWFQSLLDDTLTPDTGSSTPKIVDMGAYESLPDRIGPAVQDWILAEDTGTDSADKLTNDTTLQLTSTFAGIVFGEDFNEASGDLIVDNISTSQFNNDIAMLSNDSDGDIESRVSTTKKDDTPQLYVNYNEIGIEETTSIGVRAPHWAKLVLKTQYVSALKAKDRKLIRLILDEYVEKAQLSITLNISRLSLVLRSSQPE